MMRSSILDLRFSYAYRQLVELELKFECAADIHRPAVFHRGLKAGLHGRFDGFPVQAVRQSLFHVNASDLTIGAENDAQYHGSLDLIVSGSPRILSVLFV